MSVTSPAPTESIEPTSDLRFTAPEARAFCERYGLIDAVSETARLLREAFPSNAGIEVALKHDPEITGVCWLALIVRAHGTAPELVRAHDAFLDRWVPVTPAHVRDRITPTFTPA